MTPKARELIFIAVGEASMAWTNTPTGNFDSFKAVEIGEKLICDLEELELSDATPNQPPAA